MQVRILDTNDAEAFWNLRLRALHENPESFGASYEEILARGIAGTAQGLARREGAPEHVTFGAFDEHAQLLGIAGFRREEETKKRHKGLIWGMYVPQELRGHGIGKALLEAAVEYAKSLPGLERINLAVVLTSKEARLLFVAHGFQSYGVERHALKLHDRYFDQELMVLPLK
ncbi:MAG TPA: GNAT family N-acetyltransferase [Ktedonobacteraceae bacterium]|jgi:GNAT superfamily N-acetyltransferase|nr:GNAT family N-acetyltransferase [Ktedonobacteraceae bacterium]